MSASFVLPAQLILDTNGDQPSTYSLRFFNAGTTTPKTVYSDNALSTAINQPIPVSTPGVFPQIYIPVGLYKVGLYTDAAGTIFAPGYPKDNCDTGIPAGSGAVAVANGGTGATTAAGARTNLAAASQSDLTTQASALAAIQAQIAALPGAAIVTTGTLTRAFLQAGFGSIAIQRSEIISSTAQATCAGLVPYDNTRPQSSEGTQVLTGNFTPVSATSQMVVRVEASFGGSTADNVCVALFQDTGADAIGARWFSLAGVAYTGFVSFEVRVASVSTAATAFKVRMGAGGSTTYFNGVSSGRIGGDTIKSSIHVTEWLSF